MLERRFKLSTCVAALVEMGISGEVAEAAARAAGGDAEAAGNLCFSGMRPSLSLQLLGTCHSYRSCREPVLLRHVTNTVTAAARKYYYCLKGKSHSSHVHFHSAMAARLRSLFNITMQQLFALISDMSIP